LKENNENDMVADGICFDFYYWSKPRQTGQKGCPAFVDTRLAASSVKNKNKTPIPFL
jgi:hypothetical protein